MSDSKATDETMRAWRVHEYGQPLDVMRLETVEVPTPGPGEVRVRAHAIPLNLNDLERITGGNMMAPPAFPYSPGMETMGVVDACGEGAEHWLGRRVVATTRQAFGGFAERAICPTAALFDMPDDVALPGAAALYFPFHLAWLGLFDRARLVEGETVLISAAAGGAGSAAIQLAKHAGARVLATAGSDEKVQLCRELGADVAINYNTQDFAEIVLGETANRGVDVVFDNVGESFWESTIKCTAYNGRFIMNGFSSNKTVADKPFVVPRRVALANISLCGVLLNYAGDDLVDMLKTALGWNVARTALGAQITADLVELVRAGSIRPVVGKVGTFEEIPVLIDAMGNRQTMGRTIIMIEHHDRAS